jgi:membrane-associated phospholipid phosphatase
MLTFHSMTTVAWLSALTILLLVSFGTRSIPLLAVGQFAKNLTSSAKFSAHFIALIAILLLNKLELRFESLLTAAVDYTEQFQDWDRGFVGWIQASLHVPWLTEGLSYMYLVVFHSLLVASLILYGSRTDKRLYYATCYAIMLNYGIAIPFFIFFPVNEVWVNDPSVQLRLLDVFPRFESEYRLLSGIDNCFPSLHTSISVTLAVLAIRSDSSKWAWLCAACAVAIIFSIFYLGIHWFLDMAGGVALGLFAAYAGIRLSVREPEEMLLRRLASAGGGN